MACRRRSAPWFCRNARAGAAFISRGISMLIERIWSANAYRNFHYLIACPESGEALAVDPLEWQLVQAAARAKGWTITQILNTHEHRDHTLSLIHI